MQKQTQTNQQVVSYRYFQQFVNIISNNIDKFIEVYFNNKKILEDDNMGWLAGINQDDIPGPYDDIDYNQWNSYSYDGYNGYDN